MSDHGCRRLASTRHTVVELQAPIEITSPSGFANRTENMISLTGITLRHGPEPLLENASATIYPGHKVGLVGANGSGKSSLFSLLLGQMSVDQGEASLPGDWTIGYMAQEIGDLDRPAIDYVIDGDRRLRDAEAKLAQAEAVGDGHAMAEAHARLDDAGSYTARARAGALLSGLGFAAASHEQPVGSFSGGWRIRLSLARALMTPSDLLLLDEPTNHLDPANQVTMLNVLHRQVREKRKAALMALHEVNLATCYCSHVLLLYGNGEWDAGPSSELLTADNLSRLYRCRVRLVDDGRQRVFAVAGGAGGPGEHSAG